MNFKQFISSVSAFAVASSVFAGLAVTASAARTPVYTLQPADKKQVSYTLTDADAADVTNHNATAEEGQIADVNDFGEGTTKTNAVSELDGWGYRHSVANGVSLVGRQTSLSLTTDGIVLNNIGNTVHYKSAVSFTPANNTAAAAASGDVYYSFNAVVAKTGGDKAVTFNISFNKGTGATINQVGTVNLPEGSYSVVMNYNTTTGAYSVIVGNEIKSSGTDNSIQGFAAIATGQSYGTITISDFEYGTVAAAPATYTIKYVNAEGETIKDAVQRDANEGDIPALSAEDKPATIDHDGTTYYYDKDDSAEQTVQADNSTVVTVTYRAAEPYTATVTAKGDDGTELGTYSQEIADKSLTAYVFHPVLIEKNGSWYKFNASGRGNGYYQETITSGQNSKEVTYNKVSDNIVYYGEFEDVDGVTANGNGTYPDRYSMGKAVRNGTLTTDVLPAGKYEVYIGARNGSSKTDYNVYVKNGDSQLAVMKFGYGSSTSNNPSNTETITLNAPAALTISTENNNMQMDFVYVVKTGEYVAPTTHNEGYTFTSSIEQAKEKSLVIIGQNGEGTDSTPVTISLADKLSTFEGGDAILSVFIKDIPDGITIKSISLE